MTTAFINTNRKYDYFFLKILKWYKITKTCKGSNSTGTKVL